MTTPTRRHAVYGVQKDGTAICACGQSMPEADVDTHVTAGNAETPEPATPTVRVTPAGMLVAELNGGRLTVDPAQALNLARALREHVYTTAPAMLRVLGAGTGPASTPTPLADPDAHPEIPAEDLVHGLACPHPGCDHIAWDDWEADVLVVDEDERWSRFGYHRDQVPELAPYDPANPTGRRQPTGRQVWAETITGGYADTDHQGLGYRCGGCRRPVTLPPGVEEEGN